MLNLLWVNDNPNEETICDTCRYFIGSVWVPGTELPLPLHPNCYCNYFPTDQEPSGITLDRVPSGVRQALIRYVAWLLLAGIELGLFLEGLRREAEDYNKKKEAEGMEENTVLRYEMGKVLLTGPINGHLGEMSLPGRREYDCDFMAAGRVRKADGEDSNWLIPPEVLATHFGQFDGIPSYLDHPSLFGFGWRQDPKVKDLVGITFSAGYDAERKVITGGLRLYDEDPNSAGYLVGVLMDQILADKGRGLSVPPVGLSAVFFQISHLDEETGLRVTDEIRHVESLDVVYAPGAAGYIKEALGAIRPGYWSAMTLPRVELNSLSAGGTETMPEEHKEKEVLDAGNTPEPNGRLGEASLPDGSLPDGLDLRFQALEATVGRLTDIVAAQAEARAVQGVGSPIRGMHTGMDQVTLALDAMIEGVSPPSGVRPLTGMRELYTLLSGDYEMTGRFMEDRIYLSNVNCSTLAGLVANALNKRVINLFQSYPQWWGPAVTVQDFATLQQVKWITLGGVGELPTVTEGAAYTELTWDDQTETATFVKKGGYLGLTIEAIDKDDTHKLQAAPRALAQAAWMTLGKTISAIFTAASGLGADLSDSIALFNASHSNLGSTALSDAAWKTTKIAMMKQTEVHSAERLSALTRPRFLWVPIDLEATAVEILASGEGVPATADYHVNVEANSDLMTGRLQAARARVITVPFWTDTNNWAAQADPNLYPSIGLGFRYGRTPEVFSVASPTAGLMFSNDVMPIKVRFFFAVGATDYRGLYKHNV